MFALTYNIVIGGKTFSGVNDVVIKRSISNLVGTAVIKVPSTAVLKQTDGSKLNVLTSQQVKRGDTVEIELGYNGKNIKEFSGYVTRVNLTMPLEIECVDAVFKLRERSIKKSYDKTKLTTVLTDLLAGTGLSFETNGMDVDIEKLLLCTDSFGEVTREIALQNVIERYGLVGYFDTNQKLFVGLRQGKRLKTVSLKLGWNTIKDDDLKYYKAEEMKVKIKAVYVDKLGTRTEIEVGDPEGASRTIFLTDVSDKTKLKQLAEHELEKYKFNGYAGKLTAFLQPFCEPACIVSIADEKYSERAGNYYCDGIELSFGTNGARRKIDIGAKV